MCWFSLWWAVHFIELFLSAILKWWEIKDKSFSKAKLDRLNGIMAQSWKQFEILQYLDLPGQWQKTKNIQTNYWDSLYSTLEERYQVFKSYNLSNGSIKRETFFRIVIVWKFYLTVYKPNKNKTKQNKTKQNVRKKMNNIKSF
jgi:hypothetical protein